MKTTIRFLHAGESIPCSPPKRYTNGQRYVRLRWKIGKWSYVEVWEHRVNNGKVVNGIVHHKNHNKQDNAPDNLLGCISDLEHAAHHRRIDHSKVAELYKDGLSAVNLAEMFSTDSGNIFRILKRQGIELRFGKGKPGNRLGFRKSSLVIPP